MPIVQGIGETSRPEIIWGWFNESVLPVMLKMGAHKVEQAVCSASKMLVENLLNHFVVMVIPDVCILLTINACFYFILFY